MSKFPVAIILLGNWPHAKSFRPRQLLPSGTQSMSVESTFLMFYVVYPTFIFVPIPVVFYSALLHLNLVITLSFLSVSERLQVLEHAISRHHPVPMPHLALQPSATLSILLFALCFWRPRLTAPTAC